MPGEPAPDTVAERPLTAPDERTRNAVLLGALMVGLLVCAVFFPMLHYDFISYDVHDQIINNPYIRGLTGANLRHIFTSRCITSYYPIRTVSYAIDYQVWGLSPFGFKLTNGLIHLANVMLLFALLLRLLACSGSRETSGSRTLASPATPLPVGASCLSGWFRTAIPPRDVLVAALACCLFGIHPAIVEPVCWIPGREELLMTLGALGSVHCHLTARYLEECGCRYRWVLAFHGATAALCLAACLSNIVGAVIPGLILASDLFVQRRVGWRRIIVSTTVLGAIGMAAITVKMSGYLAHPGVQEADALAATIVGLDLGDNPGPYDPGVWDMERLKLVLRVYWLNLKTLAWPDDLTLAYLPARPVGFSYPEVVLGALAVVATLFALWFSRKRRLCLFGLVWFLLALGPVSQVVPHHIIRADRHLYLPLAGLAISLATVLWRFRLALRQSAVKWSALAIGVLLILLVAVAASKQVQTWRDNRSVWERGVSVLPNSPVAHRALADTLLKQKDFDRAFFHYHAALKADVFDPTNASHFARALATCDDLERRDYDLAIHLGEWATQLTRGRNPEVSRDLAMVYNNHADALRQQGELRATIARYRQAIEADPSFTAPIFNLALLLATCSDDDLRDITESVRLAEQGIETLVEPDVNSLMIVATAYAAAGQRSQAIEATEQAIFRVNAQGDIERAAALRQRLRIYRRQRD